jgi:cobalt-zinc-cadmium efflux system membrane fusion protein
MKNQIIKLFVLLFIAGFVSACGNEGDANGQNDQEGEQHERHEGHGEEGMGEVHLSNLKFKSLGMKVDTMPTRPISGVVEANGQLEVPPQHEATVTAIVGGNTTSIKVIEGDKSTKARCWPTCLTQSLLKFKPNTSRLTTAANTLSRNTIGKKSCTKKE